MYPAYVVFFFKKKSTSMIIIHIRSELAVVPIFTNTSDTVGERSLSQCLYLLSLSEQSADLQVRGL